jgi:molecular chaperone DnaJ
MKDYYSTLGVSREASADEIKKAFRARARECHPDVCEAGDGEERFKEVNEAYEVLSDERKREVYDRFGSTDPRATGFGDGVPFQDIFGMGMDDVISMFFGGGRARSATARAAGRDMQVQLVATLEELVTGVDKEVDVTRLASCETCGGSGSASGEPKTCEACGGTGQRQTVRQTFLGTMQTLAPCAECEATGQVLEDPCAACRGSGRVQSRESIPVSVPAGARAGATLRVPGKGESGLRGAGGGDLVVIVRVAPHDRFYRDGDDLHVRVRVPFTRATLGGRVVVAGLDAEVEVKVPSGAQFGDTVKAKGAGMPRSRGSRGDLIVHLALEPPRRLGKKQKRLVEELEDSFELDDGPVPTDRLRDWLGR